MHFGPRSIANTIVNGNGGNLSTASSLVSTMRLTSSGGWTSMSSGQLPAGVVADEPHIGQAEVRDELVDQLGNATRRKLPAVVDRDAM